MKTKAIDAIKVTLLGALLSVAAGVEAGCIGTVIEGRCFGDSVQWDTHPDGWETPEAPSGFMWDKRNTPWQSKGWVSPETGVDPHDPNWHGGAATTPW